MLFNPLTPPPNDDSPTLDNLENTISKPINERKIYATLDEFLSATSSHAFRFAELNLRHREDSLDVVQDAMLKLLKYRDRPAEEWQVLFWSILRRRIIDIQRRRTFRLKFWVSTPEDTAEDYLADWADPTANPMQSHAEQQTYNQLIKALKELPARQREAFVLRILQGFDGATTAQVMGCPEGSVKTHLSRARAALQIQLEDFQ